MGARPLKATCSCQKSTGCAVVTVSFPRPTEFFCDVWLFSGGAGWIAFSGGSRLGLIFGPGVAASCAVIIILVAAIRAIKRLLNTCGVIQGTSRLSCL